MHKLNPDEYGQVRPIFDSMDHHLAVRSVLKGGVPGTVYVDDPARPSTALTRLKHRFYLAGHPGNAAFNRALQRFFADEVYPQSIAARDQGLVLYYAPDAWAEQIDVVLKDKHPIDGMRQFYATGRLAADPQAFVPQGYALQRIDRTFAQDATVKNHDLMIQEILSERHSMEQFFTQNFGFCALHEHEIVGLCLSEHNTGDRCEVGIQTMAGHRRKGLATAMGLTLIAHALANGVTQVGWHCWADNRGSIATAIKIGLRKTLDYPACFAYVEEGANLAAHGHHHLQRGRYREALDWLERAFETGQAPTWAHLAAARASAALQEHESALAHLNVAIDRGWQHAAQLHEWPEFDGLLETPAWQTALARIQADAEKNDDP